MKVLLQLRGVTLTGKETAWPLLELLRSNNIVIPEADNALTATVRLRNTHGGHGSGGTVRNVPEAVAALAVQTAATAIAMIAGGR